MITPPLQQHKRSLNALLPSTRLSLIFSQLPISNETIPIISAPLVQWCTENNALNGFCLEFFISSLVLGMDKIRGQPAKKFCDFENYL